MSSLGLLANSKMRFLRDLLGLLMAQVVVKVIGFLAFAYLARTLSQQSYGAVEVVISLAGLTLLLIDFGLGQIGVRELKLKNGSEDVVHAIPTLRAMIALICLPPFMIFGLSYFDDPHHELLIYLFAITLILSAWRQEWFLQASEKVPKVGIGQALRIIIFAALVFFLVKRPDDVLLVGVVEVISVICWVGYLVYTQIDLGVSPRLRFEKSQASDLMRQSAPLGVASVSWGVVQYVPPIVVATFAGLHEAALLAVAQRIVASLQTLSFVYHFSLYTALIERYRESVEALQKLVHASIRAIAWATIGPAVICAFHASELMVLIFGEKYAAAGVPFSALVFVIPIQLLAGHHRWTLTTIGRPTSVMFANGSGAVVAVLGSLAAVPFFGADGAAFAGVLAAVTIWSVAAYQCRLHGAPLMMARGAIRAVIAALVICFAISQLTVLNWWEQSILTVLVYYGVIPIVDRQFLGDLRHVAYAKKHLAEVPPEPAD